VPIQGEIALSRVQIKWREDETLDTQFRRATNAKLEGPLDKFHIFIARRVMRCICTLNEIP